MALHTHDLGRPQGLPLEAVLASIPSYPRPVIERLVSRLIDTLDEQDEPTMDMEEDDPSGQMDEDGINTGVPIYFLHGRAYYGPGCPISDSDRSDLER